jgi:Nuclease-related domain
MAQTLTNERSLLRRQEAIESELNLLKRMRILEWSAAILFILFGLIWKFAVMGSAFPLVIGGGLLFLALGHEARRKESLQEHADTQSMRSAKEEMAKLLDEKLANDHFVLNDLRLKSGREKCWIDHLIVAPSGMFVINTLNWSGKIIGDTSKKSHTWKIRAADGSTRPARNPIGRVLRERRLLCNWLKGTQLIWERVHPLVVLGNPEADSQVTNSENRVFTPEQAVTFINDFCFEKPILSNEEVKKLADGLNEQQD